MEINNDGFWTVDIRWDNFYSYLLPEVPYWRAVKILGDEDE